MKIQKSKVSNTYIKRILDLFEELLYGMRLVSRFNTQMIGHIIETTNEINIILANELGNNIRTNNVKFQLSITSFSNQL